VEYFFYCRDSAEHSHLRDGLAEEHWSFMDSYADRMIARGPTFTDDETAMLGSMHIVDLPDAEAARVFAYEEPCYKAGVYEKVEVYRFRNLLGRTMWDFTGAVEGRNRYLLLGYGSSASPLSSASSASSVDTALIVYGSIDTEDGTPVGTVTCLEATDRSALPAGIEAHRWRFGGRPAS
jgi:uncharacterized protein YciI